jgi:hypothetical protein
MVFLGFLMKRTKPVPPCTPFPSEPPLPALLPLSLRTFSFLAPTLPPCNRSSLPAYWPSHRSTRGRAASQQVESLTHTTRHTHDSHTCTHTTQDTQHTQHIRKHHNTDNTPRTQHNIDNTPHTKHSGIHRCTPGDRAAGLDTFACFPTQAKDQKDQVAL